MLWSVWHPFHPVSRFIDRTVFDLPIVRVRQIQPGEAWFRTFDDDPAWTALDVQTNGQAVFRHNQTGVTRSYEQVHSCRPDWLAQANAQRLIDSGRISPDTDVSAFSDKWFDWIDRDEEGRIIDLRVARFNPVGDNLWAEFQSDPSPMKNEFYRILDDERDAQMQMLLTEPKMSFDEFIEQYMAEMARKETLSSNKNRSVDPD